MLKHLLIAGLAVTSLSAQALIEIGDPVPNKCWKDATDQQVCLDDYKDNVRVLVFSAGY